MENQIRSPWVIGPIEILTYADSLRTDMSGSSRRLCFLIVDNAVEVLIRTFLTLPKRVTHIEISRKEFQDATDSFPKLLDLLENKAKQKLVNVELGEIEYYHRQRNQLYHNGAGITIESSLVEGYFIQAIYLLLDLFKVQFEIQPEKGRPNFLLEWAKFERWVRYITFHFAKPSKDGRTRVPFQTPIYLIQKYFPIKLSENLIKKLKNLQEARNLISHGLSSLDESTNAKLLKDVKYLWTQFDKSLEDIKIDIQEAQKGFEKHLTDVSVDLGSK